MDLSFNRSVQKDVDEVINHYEAISDQLVSRFFRDMEIRLSEIRENPKRFSKDQNYPLYRGQFTQIHTYLLDLSKFCNVKLNLAGYHFTFRLTYG